MPTRKEDYYYVGAMLRDELIKAIDALDWDKDKPQAAKIKSALQLAAPQRKGYLFDTHGWTWNDEDFLKSIIDMVEEDESHSALSRGAAFGNTAIARQIRALREKL